MIKKNMKLIIGIVLGLLVTTGVYAVNTLNASSISIDKKNMTKVPESNLQSALDYLYSKSKTTNMITIESGVLHETQTYLGVAYLDPTDLTKKCTSQNSSSATGTKVGCMKWYIYKDLGDSYKLILDHNTTVTIAWNTKGDNGTNVAFAPNATEDESLNNLAYIELQKLVSENSWVVTPDLIEASEVAEIVGKTGYTNIGSWYCLDSLQADNTNYCAKVQGTSAYSWLFDNTNGCAGYGCNTADSSNSGYWSKTIYGTAGSGSYVWRVTRLGSFGGYHANLTEYGLRPVITISKNLFQN